MKNLLWIILDKFFSILQSSHNHIKLKEYFNKFQIHESVKIFEIEKTTFRGNISIGPNTYLNRCWLETGSNSKIVIGEWCAVGYNSFIMSITHDTIIATGPHTTRPFKEADIIIGNNVWIGANCYIREGVKIGNNSVIGANSVVTKDVPENAVVGGVPAKLLKIK